MGKPEVLLINLNQRNADAEVMRLLGGDCNISCITDSSSIGKAIASISPKLLCFEYDYPDIPRLAALQETKLAYPSLPIVMVTLQHSVALSLWALRSRVWDFFIKPVPATDVLECFRTIQALPDRERDLSPRVFSLRPCSLPLDARFRDQRETRNHRVVRTAINYVEKNLQHRICQAEVAQACDETCSQFSRIFKQCHGTTFTEYVLRRRMGQAVKMLQNPSATITDVCYTVGFNDQSYFTRLFRRYVGISPSVYRDNLNKTHASLLPQSVTG